VPKKKLGKGLKELLLGDDAAEQQVEEIEISSIVPNRQQPRKQFDERSLEALTASIKEHGVVQPIIVRADKEDRTKYELIAGERRLRAASMADLKTIPALVRDYSDERSAEIAIIENLQREDLNPLEEGMEFERLIQDYHFTQEKMASVIGKSRSYVTNIMRLLDLPEEVKQMITNKQLTAGQARPLLGLSTQAEQLSLARRTIREELSVRRIEEIIRQGKGKKPQGSMTQQVDTALRAMEDDLHMAVGTKVRIKIGKGKNSHRGTISISFKNDKEFERITGLLKANNT
jgi:ParB family chromosome partitioning protein